jgi:hypothetical protein
MFAITPHDKLKKLFPLVVVANGAANTSAPKHNWLEISSSEIYEKRTNSINPAIVDW